MVQQLGVLASINALFCLTFFIFNAFLLVFRILFKGQGLTAPKIRDESALRMRIKGTECFLVGVAFFNLLRFIHYCFLLNNAYPTVDRATFVDDLSFYAVFAGTVTYVLGVTIDIYLPILKATNPNFPISTRAPSIASSKRQSILKRTASVVSAHSHLLSSVRIVSFPWILDSLLLVLLFGPPASIITVTFVGDRFNAFTHENLYHARFWLWFGWEAILCLILANISVNYERSVAGRLYALLTKSKGKHLREQATKMLKVVNHLRFLTALLLALHTLFFIMYLCAAIPTAGPAQYLNTSKVFFWIYYLTWTWIPTLALIGATASVAGTSISDTPTVPGLPASMTSKRAETEKEKVAPMVLEKRPEIPVRRHPSTRVAPTPAPAEIELDDAFAKRTNAMRPESEIDGDHSLVTFDEEMYPSSIFARSQDSQTESQTNDFTETRTAMYHTAFETAQDDNRDYESDPEEELKEAPAPLRRPSQIARVPAPPRPALEVAIPKRDSSMTSPPTPRQGLARSSTRASNSSSASGGTVRNTRSVVSPSAMPTIMSDSDAQSLRSDRSRTSSRNMPNFSYPMPRGYERSTESLSRSPGSAR